MSLMRKYFLYSWKNGRREQDRVFVLPVLLQNRMFPSIYLLSNIGLRVKVWVESF